VDHDLSLVGRLHVDGAGQMFSDSKRDGFRPYMNIPSKVAAQFVLAVNLAGQSEEQATIKAFGFKLVDPYTVASTPVHYRAFIQESAGEFSAAKPSYVKLRTGWISDRTLCYLASGKPCIIEDTGFSQSLQDSTKGLRSFKDLKGAVRCFERVLANYEEESRFARFIAEDLFDAKKICRAMLDRVL
jgi:hypothetical protein